MTKRKAVGEPLQPAAPMIVEIIGGLFTPTIRKPKITPK